jgi:trans-aconitate 2-methyltransferase
VVLPVARDWDASTYDRLPIPMTGWGRAVVDRVPLDGDERVLDAGCGTGQVTAYLRERLPHGEVLALDGSPAMLARARERLGEERVTYVEADLREPLPIDPVDAIVSTATFHWIPDHDRLFVHLAAALRRGGPLVAQCGGEGNLDRLAEVVAGFGHDVRTDKTFANPGDTERRLRAAGFTEIRCWLASEPTPIPREDLPAYLRTVCMGGVVDELADDEAHDLVQRVAAAMPEPAIDYVRLNIDARRGAR